PALHGTGTQTCRNATWPVNASVIMTIRATQQKIMSKPVTSTDDGRNCASSGNRFGRPSRNGCFGSTRLENGTSADENQVSSTSASRTSGPDQPAAFACARASASLRATNTLPSWIGWPSASALYQAGIWWPHQSWREMHQSWMFVSQWL